MAFLLVVPHALIGVFGLALFFVLIYYQIGLYNMGESRSYRVAALKGVLNAKFFKNYQPKKSVVDFNFAYQVRFFAFVMACLYTTTFLPNGKYYLSVGGNEALLISYLLIFLHLTFPMHSRSTTKRTAV